jgi:hypothetical protein
MNVKKTYTKPAMMVYRLRTQPQLLQQSLPKQDVEAYEQW